MKNVIRRLYLHLIELLALHYLSGHFYYGSFQVETVGDKYMAVSGLPDACENHARVIAKLALDMMDMAKNVTMGTEVVVSGIEILFLLRNAEENGDKTFLEDGRC
jgi:hypothetical protein